MVQALIDDRIQVTVCPALLRELESVLARPKLRDRVSEAVSREYVARLRRHAQLVSDPTPLTGAVRDPEDDYLVALARSIQADAIVTVDRDLLDAEQLHPPAITPRKLLDASSS